MAALVDKRYYEDMNVGDTEVSMGRTVTETDIVNFAGLRGDCNTLHADAEYAKGSIAGQRIAHGLLPLCICSGLYTRTAYNLSMLETLTAFTEIKNWKFKKPVLIGDTIHMKMEIVEKTDTKPGATSGKVVFHRSVINQRDEVVQEGDFVLLIKKRPTAD